MSEKPKDTDQIEDKKEEAAPEIPEESEDLEEPDEEEAEPAAEEPEEKEAAEEEEEEEIEIVEERVYTIPFRKAWISPRGKRTPRVSRMLRDFAKRHMKTDNVQISNEVNEALWTRGIKKPPRRIQVRLAKDKEGKVIVYPVTAA